MSNEAEYGGPSEKSLFWELVANDFCFGAAWVWIEIWMYRSEELKETLRSISQGLRSIVERSEWPHEALDAGKLLDFVRNLVVTAR